MDRYILIGTFRESDNICEGNKSLPNLKNIFKIPFISNLHMDCNCWYFELDSTFQKSSLPLITVSVATFTGIKMTVIIIKITEVKMLITEVWVPDVFTVNHVHYGESLHTAQACTNTRAGSWNYTAALGCGARPTPPPCLPTPREISTGRVGAQGRSLSHPSTDLFEGFKHRIPTLTSCEQTRSIHKAWFTSFRNLGWHLSAAGFDGAGTLISKPQFCVVTRVAVGELGPLASIWNEINIQSMDNKGVPGLWGSSQARHVKKKKKKENP